jgi:iron complex outermembrane receptor protein
MRSLLLLLLLSSSAVSAQRDTLRANLAPAEVSAMRHTFRQGFLDTRQLDTSLLAIMPAHTLSDRLEREAALFIKSYGPGSLSTLSLRGTGATHTAIVWNGLTLNSPMLGLTDLSFFPAFLTENIQVEYGGNGPLGGNGAVGGSIRLDNSLSFRSGNRATLFAGTGSFGQQRGGAGYLWSNGKVVTQTKIYHEQAGNNFTYQRPDGTRIRQQHARFLQTGITQDFKTGRADHFIEGHVMLLRNEREIPPHMLAEISQQQQYDEVIRGVISWNRIFQKAAVKVMAGVSDEMIHYKDPAARLDEKSRSRVWQAEAEAGVTLNPWLRLTGQAGTMLAQASVESYTGDPEMEQFSIAAALQADRRKWKAQLAAKQVFFDGKSVPLLPSFSFSVPLYRYISFRGNIAGIYRLPTLNDRFWQPGGDPNLKPEQGYSGSAGLITELRRNNSSLRFTANLFQSVLQQAIVWYPATDGLYHAGNIQTLNSRGLDATMALNIHYGKLSLQLSGGPVYTEAIVTKADGVFTEAINKQLVYTPRVLWKGMLELGYQQFSVRYNHTYTGYRFITADHAHHLDPYDVAELHLGWKRLFGKNELIFTGSIKNLYNADYQIIAWRAMPGRWYEAGIMFRFGR